MLARVYMIVKSLKQKEQEVDVLIASAAQQKPAFRQPGAAEVELVDEPKKLK